jgi:hypothetical protein
MEQPNKAMEERECSKPNLGGLLVHERIVSCNLFVRSSNAIFDGHLFSGLFCMCAISGSRL